MRMKEAAMVVRGLLVIISDNLSHHSLDEEYNKTLESICKRPVNFPHRSLHKSALTSDASQAR